MKPAIPSHRGNSIRADFNDSQTVELPLAVRGRMCF